MKLDIPFLGLKLKSPLILGASPLSDNLDMVRRFEDAGAGAVIMRSIFEEQIEQEERAFDHHVSSHEGISAEASIGYLPKFTDFAFDMEGYLNHIQRVKACVGIPVMGSLNGNTPGGWDKYSRLIQEAGADALELNFYDLPTDPSESCLEFEGRYIQILKDVRALVKIPIAVKLSPFFSSLPNFVQRLSDVGADGVVLFNRLYQPDIDIENLKVFSALELSDSQELALRLRWLAILEPHFKGSLAVSGGVHTTVDVIKSIMTGASGVQMVSALIKNGPTYLSKITSELSQWLDEHEYESVSQMLGSMSLRTCPDPSEFSRNSYMKILRGWNLPEFQQFK